MQQLNFCRRALLTGVGAVVALLPLRARAAIPSLSLESRDEGEQNE